MNYDRVILGKDCVYSTDCEETGINNNVLVLAGSGCGKTMSISEPKLLETRNGSLVVTVSKRRLVHMYKSLMLQRGYAVKYLDFADPDAGDDGWDPLESVNEEQDITYLARAFVMADPRKDHSYADPYWDQTATSLLSALIGYVMMTKKQPNFNDVLDLLENLSIDSESGGMIKTNLDDSFSDLARRKPACLAVSCWKSFHETPLKTNLCILSSLSTTVDAMFSPKLRRMFGMERRVCPEALVRQKTVLFVNSSPVNPTLNSLINIFYSQLIKGLFELGEAQPDGRLPLPVNLLFDDFAVGGRIYAFPEYISCFREKQISCTLLLQSYAQLEAMYGNSSRIITDNCDSIVYMGGMDVNTCRDMSLRANLPLEDVLYMPVGRVFIFRRGQKPIFTTRYEIREDMRYQAAYSIWEEAVSQAQSSAEAPSKKNSASLISLRTSADKREAARRTPRRFANTQQPDPSAQGKGGFASSISERSSETGDHRRRIHRKAEVASDLVSFSPEEERKQLLDKLSNAQRMAEISRRLDRRDLQVEALKCVCKYSVELYGEGDELSLTAMQTLAMLYSHLNDAQQAIQLLNKVYMQRLCQNDRSDQDALKILAQMVLLYEQLGNSRRSLACLSRLKARCGDKWPELVKETEWKRSELSAAKHSDG